MKSSRVFVKLCLCFLVFFTFNKSHADTATEIFFGIIYNGENFQRIEYPGAGGTFIHDINDSGVVVGRYLIGGTSYGFVYDGSVFKEIRPSGASSCSVEGINNLGDIVGWYDADEVRHGFLLPAGSERFQLINFPGYELYAVSDINDSGFIIGWHLLNGIHYGFTYDGVSFNQSLSYPGATETTFASINDSGDITGFYLFPSEEREGQSAFIVDASLNQETLIYKDSDRTGTGGINNSGHVAGWYVAGGGRYGFVYDGTAYTSISYPGIGDTKLTGINSSGVVAGVGSEIIVTEEDDICFIQTLLD